jgi:integrase
MSNIWNDEGNWVFPTQRGTFKDSHNLRRILKRTFPEWNHGFHALRHWFASVGFDAGMGEVQIARLLGHRSTATTKDTYGHLLDDGAQTLLDSVARLLRDKN